MEARGDGDEILELARLWTSLEEVELAFVTDRGLACLEGMKRVAFQ